MDTALAARASRVLHHRLTYHTAMIEEELFHVTAEVYRGQETRIYRATRRLDGTRVLIKHLAAEYPNQEQIVRFEREYALLRKLAGPGIPTALALEPHGHSRRIVFDDEGLESLDRLPVPLPLDSFFACAHQLVAILARVHTARVLHKDVTPANVVLHPLRGHVQLIDYGLAAELPRELHAANRPALLEGTLRFMAPEQTGRMNRGVDYRADYYGLGATLYFALTGRAPFESDDALDLVHSHIARSPPLACDCRPGVPRSLSAVIDKLLSKTPEARYQSSSGLLFDLERCASDWSRGVDEEFVLGSADHSEQFTVSEVLYGREPQVATLLSAFNRAAAGQTEVLLLPGAPGIGKSVLINEVQRPIVASRGLYAAGKFDQFNRGIPFAAVLQAFRNLLRQILTEEESVLRGYRESFDAALGSNLSVVAEVVPELTLITGPRPPVPVLPPSETQNRFESSIANFVHVLAAPTHPLVLVLDDLQWADVPSLNLLVQICARSRHGHLLVIGAYRDGEIGPGHPLDIALHDLTERGIAMTKLAVGALDDEHVQALVAATLRTAPPQIQDFAQVLATRTAGNPFFVTQFLHRLHRQGLITWDVATRRFRVAEQALQHMPVSDNVADLMLSALTQLPAPTQRALRLAACIGAEFDLATLAAVCGELRTATAQMLWPALVDGLLLPLSGAYRTVSESDDTAVRYRFAHDRVQQAAYGLLQEAERAPTHHAIGERLLHELAPSEREDRLFEIVTHLNKGLQERRDADARDALADLNLRAAQRAMAATAFSSAWQLLQTALQLRGPDRFERNYQAALNLNTAAAEGAVYADDMAAMEGLVAEVEKNARSTLDKVRVREVLIRGYIVKGRGSEALRVGRMHLRELGEEIPEKLGTGRLLLELFRSMRALGGRTPEQILALPAMRDPIKQAAVSACGLLTAYAYVANPPLTLILGRRQMSLAMRYGLSPATPLALGGHAALFCGQLAKMDEGIRLSRLSVQMAERPESAPYRCRVWIYSAWFCESWVLPALESSDRALKIWAMSLDAGDQETAIMAACMRVLYDLLGNRPIQTMLEEARSLRQVWQRSSSQPWPQITYVVEQMLINLRAPCADVAELSSEFLNQAELLQNPSAYDPRILLFLGWHRGTLLYIDDRIDEAVAALAASRRYLKSMPLCWVPTIWHTQHALVDAVRLPQMTLRERLRAKRRIERSLRALRKHAQHHSGMSDHRLALLEAEYAAGLGRDGQAMDAFDRAIAAAHKAQLPGEQAIACERAARFHQARGRRTVALSYFRDACRAWSVWGAHGRVHALQQRMPDLIDGPSSVGVSVKQSNQGISEEVLQQAFDASAVINVAQAIADETDVPSLLQRVLTQTLEHSGARRGTLILQRAGQPCAQATIDVSEGGPLQMLDRPLRESSSRDDPWPAAIARFALRTHETVVLDDAQAAGSTFAKDAWVQARRARSLLALPLSRQGRVLGVLLLDNELTTAAFTPERLHAVRVIATQAAIALDNALLQHALSTSLEEQTALARANQRFVPAEFLAALGRTSITKVELGDSVQKELTILFSDMRGFTSHVEGNTPEQNIHFINDYLAAMEPAILQHGGFVDSYIGDAIMALFAVGADRALRASIDMLRNLETYNAARRARRAAEVRIGIGLNTGIVTLGTIGGPQRIKCGVIGDAVNLGARVESLSKSYGVALILSHHTVERLQNPQAFLLRELDRVRVVGRQAAVTLYEAFDADPSLQRQQKLDAAPHWSAALRAFEARDFAGALTLFDICRPLLEHDTTWIKRRARCLQYLHHPPPQNWNGVEELAQK